MIILIIIIFNLSVLYDHDDTSKLMFVYVCLLKMCSADNTTQMKQNGRHVLSIKRFFNVLTKFKNIGQKSPRDILAGTQAQSYCVGNIFYTIYQSGQMATCT